MPISAFVYLFPFEINSIIFGVIRAALFFAPSAVFPLKCLVNKVGIVPREALVEAFEKGRLAKNNSRQSLRRDLDLFLLSALPDGMNVFGVVVPFFCENVPEPREKFR